MMHSARQSNSTVDLVGQASVFTITGSDTIKAAQSSGSLGSTLSRSTIHGQRSTGLYSRSQDNISFSPGGHRTHQGSNYALNIVYQQQADDRRFLQNTYNPETKTDQRYLKQSKMSDIRRSNNGTAPPQQIRASYVPQETPLTGMGLMYSNGVKPLVRQGASQNGVGEDRGSAQGGYSNNAYDTSEEIDSTPVYSTK